MNQKLKFLCFWGIHNSLPSFWAELGYSGIKIDHIVYSLLKFQIKIGVHLINVELSQLLTLVQKIRKTWEITRPQPFLVTQTSFSFLGWFQGMIAIPSSGQTSWENWWAEPKGITTTKVSSHFTLATWVIYLHSRGPKGSTNLTYSSCI